MLDQLSGAVEQAADISINAAPRCRPQESGRSVRLYEQAERPTLATRRPVRRPSRTIVAATTKMPSICIGGPPTASRPMSARWNLGLLYEDRNQYDRAARATSGSFGSSPTTSGLGCTWGFQASTEQVYDETPSAATGSAGVGHPVTDFECRFAAGTAGENGHPYAGRSHQISEPQLGSKNFGETSLYEIREMMNSRARIGMFASERSADFSAETQTLSTRRPGPAEQAGRRSEPVGAARKCMIRLNIATIGELVRRTGDELLECKNFGVTSLNGVRELTARPAAPRRRSRPGRRSLSPALRGASAHRVP